MTPIYSKAKGAALGSALAWLVLFLLSVFAGITLPSDIANAIVGAAGILFTYLVPERVVTAVLARLAKALADGEVTGTLAAELTGMPQPTPLPVEAPAEPVAAPVVEPAPAPAPAADAPRPAV